MTPPEQPQFEALEVPRKAAVIDYCAVTTDDDFGPYRAKGFVKLALLSMFTKVLEMISKKVSR